MADNRRDAPLEAWLLRGRPARHAKLRPARRPRQDSQRRWTPVADPDSLNPYERLMHEHAPGLSQTELHHRVFDWAMAGLGYREARQWLNAGAKGHQAELCGRFKSARISPDLAFRPFLHLGRPTGETFFDLVADGILTVDDVRRIIDGAGRGSA